MKSFAPLDVPLRGTSLIEASAGTGKTYTLTTLHLRLLLEQRLRVSQILVVTFTNAATAELRSRIRRRLRQAADGLESAITGPDAVLAALLQRRRDAGETPRDRVRLLEALYGFDDAAIFTIHGFCQRMLQENAFESGVSFDVELVADQSVLRDQIVQDFWVRELHAAPQSVVRNLAERGGALEQLGRLARVVMRDAHLPVLPAVTPQPHAGASSWGDDPGQQWVRLQRRFIEFAARELRLRSAAANSQSFDDLLQRLNDALAGPGGPVLAQRIRARFRAALVDEFQDTDPVQYEILRRLYHDAGAPLILIGDPKQAIFGFRGADVYAYMGAKRDAGGDAYTLTTNWRSAPGLVRAVHTLFSGARAEFIIRDIRLGKVRAAPSARDLLRAASGSSAPLQVLFVRRRPPVRTGKPGRSGKPARILAEWGRHDLPTAVAAHIVRMLHDLRLEDRPIVPADIAVLCRTNEAARGMQEALRRRGVPTALQGDASVFDSADAEELQRVLRAMAEPANAGAVRAALATTMIGVGAAELAALQDDERGWDAWAECFHSWHQAWMRQGFMPAFRRVLDDRGVYARLLALPDGERRLTNLLHLGELLHVAASETRRGPLALVDWLVQMHADPLAREGGTAETAQIRLESDAKAVKLVTVHKSKGLEYPIVVCPDLWGALPRSALTLFHDDRDGNRLKLDLGSPALDVHRDQAAREQLAESLRVLYVALTRAQHQCVIVWGAFARIESTALGYLLHQAEDASDDADLWPRTKQRIGSLTDDLMRADLARLEAAAGGTVAVSELSHDPGAVYVPIPAHGRELRARTATRELSSTWRTSSFSALSAGSAALTPPGEEGIDRDEMGTIPESTGAARAAAETVVLADFPAGARAGQLLHEVLERLDFEHATPEHVREVVLAQLAHHGFEACWAEALCQGVQDLLDTPLEVGGDGTLTLRAVPLQKRSSEMEFLFPVSDHDAAHAAAFTARRLASVFARAGTPTITPEYVERLQQLAFAPLSGYLRGFIDLVFEHGGRWYLVDYKSNHLGRTPHDYGAAPMRAAMSAHHYFLQYHLYVVALHRHLRRRLVGYDYDRDFGAVFYLFLRGTSPAWPAYGVFRDRPSRELVEALSAALADPDVDGAA